MCDQEVESCGCVDEECTYSHIILVLAFRREERRIHQVLTVAGNSREQFTVSVITDTGESYRTI